jgi:DNA-binding beta-propeller fold protein YncE
MVKTVFRILACVGPLLLAVTLPVRGQGYHVARTFTLGGDGGWDFLALDTVCHRLFIARQNRLMVVDPETGAVIKEIPGLARAHGIAFAQDEGHGFVTSGADSSVVMFDLATLAVLGRATAAPDADVIIYDPATKRIFTFNGNSLSATVIDPVSGHAIKTIDLQAAPEVAVSAGDGMLYVNLEDQGALAEIDARAMKITRRWSLAPCESPTGLAIDRANHRLFSGCRNKVMAISDVTAGRVVATVPIGEGVDGCRFDSASGLAFASNGGGTLTVVREDAPDRFHVVADVATRRGARTLELDECSHRIYTVTADFGPAPAATSEHPRPRPPIIPGTFVLLVLEP